MDIKSEIKSLIAKKARTMKDVCAEYGNIYNKKLSANNFTNKLTRETIKFNEIENILQILGYHIEFVENK